MKGLQRSLRRSGLRGNAATPVIHRVRRLGLPVSITDPGDANAGFTAVIGDLPEGNIGFLMGVGYFILTKNDADLTDTFTGNISVGTAPTADATLNGAEVDVLPSTAIQAAVAGVSSGNRLTNVTPLVLNNTDGSLELNLNGFIANAAISADAALLVDVDLHLVLAMLGDN